MSRRKALTLEQKIKLIKDNRNGNSLWARQLGNKYDISKNNVANILQRREEFISDYTSNCNKGVKRKHKDEDRQTIDQLAFEWFIIQRAKQTLISGSILQEKARQFANQLGYSRNTFKGSNGWLDRFRTRHAISFRTISDESASINDSTIEEWTNRLPIILDRFEAKDVFNADETGLFYRATPDCSSVLSKEECERGKKSKERFTVLLCSNWTGTEKFKPILIGRSQHPRRFKNIPTYKLLVTWLANRTAWMNCSLFVDWLISINNQMKKSNRKIPLFLDNAPCHSGLFENQTEFLSSKYYVEMSTVGSRCIRSFKCHYRQKLVKNIIAQCSVVRTVDQISMTALDVVKWINLSWKNVTELTIQNGFRAAVFVNSFNELSLYTINTDVIAEVDLESDNLADDLRQLDSLSIHIHISGQQLTAAEFIDIDSSISAFNKWDDDEHLKGLIEILQ